MPAADDPKPTHGLWADLHREGLEPENAEFSILGVPYDGGACARAGAALAPERLRFWSQHLTPYTEDRSPLGAVRVRDLGDIRIAAVPDDFERVRLAVSGLKNIGIILGGDHSISIPVLQAQRERFQDRRLGILWIDAHPDLCDVFTGSKYSHACVLRRALEAGIQPNDVAMVGLRSWEDQEIDLIETGGFHVFSAATVAEQGMKEIARSVHSLLARCEAVHISLDIDCLDPAFAPGTGIPEAGGLSSREVMTLIQSMRGLPLVGLDVVEVAPPLDPSEATVFAALRFIMEFIGVGVRTAQAIRE